MSDGEYAQKRALKPLLTLPYSLYRPTIRIFAVSESVADADCQAEKR